MKMSRLIDADAVDDVIQALNENGWCVTRSEHKRIDRILFEMPTVDAVEVLRCKDCKLFEPNTFPIRTGHPCSRVGLEPNDFCSWVEPLWEEEVEDEDD